jgi:hypothetical protein
MIETIVSFRAPAAVLVLLLAGSPVLGIVCAVVCDQPPLTSTMKSACHESTASPDGSAVSGNQAACDHNQAGTAPALAAKSTAHGSESTSLPAFRSIPADDACRANSVARHGPPGLSARRMSLHITVLRI